MLPDKWRPFLCKLVTLFFLQGYIKSTGVLLEDTVRYFHSEVYLVGLSFSLVHGLSNFLGKFLFPKHLYVSLSNDVNIRRQYDICSPEHKREKEGFSEKVQNLKNECES